MKIPYLSSAAILLLLAGTARAVPDSFLWINLSVKCIVDPATGATPPINSAGGWMDENLMRDVVADMNRWLANTWRGYRIRLVDLNANNSIRRIGALNDTTGPSKWYETDLKSYDDPMTPADENQFDDFEAAATASKTTYAWNDNAINLYINNGSYSRASFPSQNESLVIASYDLLVGQDPPPHGPSSPALSASYKIAGNLLHEIGHFFELYHTFGGLGTAPNDDNIADTALDPNNHGAARNETQVRNNIAQFNYTKNYSELTDDTQRTLVNNTANNAMAYIQLFYDDPAHNKVVPDAERFGPTRFLFTELQMDKWADYANNQRFSVMSGTMRFIDASVASSGFGTSTNAMKTLALGISAANANGNDILMLRPGTYTAASISKPMTIRATRKGAITIQKP